MMDFLNLVKEMRGWQSRWFKGDKSSEVLRESKRLERAVDRELARLLEGQGELFGEAPAAPSIPAVVSPVGSALSAPLAAVLAELERAEAKFPLWPTDPLHALAVLGEEFGELTREALQVSYREKGSASVETVRKEAVQTAAMALRFLASLDRYEFREGPQHGGPEGGRT